MRICQLCAVDFTLYQMLLPLMRGLRQAGFTVEGACRDGTLAQRVRDDGFTVHDLPLERSFNLLRHIRAFLALIRFFRKQRFDIVHVHSPIAALIARPAAAIAGVPLIVYTAHGFYFHDRMPGWKRRLYMLLEWLPGRVTDLLFTQSAEDARTAVQARLVRGEVLAIGNGADGRKFHPPAEDGSVRAAVRRECETPDEEIVILMVGRLVTEKGYPELLRAMHDVPATLWIVGERLHSEHGGAVDTAIDAAMADAGLRRRLRMLGRRDDVERLMQAADIFVLPSHREGMPRSIIEAMLSGLPIVATDIRGSREEVVPEETGLLCPVGDAPALARALARLAGDGATRARFGRAGRQRAENMFEETLVLQRQIDAIRRLSDDSVRH